MFVSLYCMYYSLALRNTSCFTRSVQHIFSVLLQHHISRLSRYFLYLFRGVQVAAPYTAVLQIQHCDSFFLKFKSVLLVTRVVSLYSIFWVIPRRLSFLCRRFGTLFLLYRSFKQEEVGAFIQHGASLKSKRGFLFNAAFAIAIHVVSGILEPEGGNVPWSSTKCGQLLA
jgi:hypothetical protein